MTPSVIDVASQSIHSVEPRTDYGGESESQIDSKKSKMPEMAEN